MAWRRKQDRRLRSSVGRLLGIGLLLLFSLLLVMFGGEAERTIFLDDQAPDGDR